MGRRSRNRAADPNQGPTHTDAPAPGPAPAASRPFGGRENLSPARRVLAAAVLAAAVLGVLTLVGIAVLGGAFGPIVLFVVVLVLAFVLQRWMTQRLDGLELTDEDRLMRMLATGVLATAAVLAFVSAAVSLAIG